MIIKKLSATIEELESIVPESYYAWLLVQKNEINSLHMFGAFEGESVLGYALYAGFKAFEKTLSLIYVETREYNRKEGVGTELLSRSLMELCANKDITVVTNIYLEDAPVICPMLEKNGFSKIDDSIMMFYEVGDVKSSILSAQLEKIAPMLKAVKKTEDIELDKAIRSYGNHLNRNPLGINLNKVDKENTYYFFKDGEILGHGFFTKPREDQLVLLDYGQKQGKDSKFAIPLIFSSAIRDHIDKDEEVTLMIYVEKKLEDAVKSILGNPQESEESAYYYYNKKD